jgi:hypothetical protein
MADKFGLHCKKADSIINSVSLRPDMQKRVLSFLRFNARKIAERLNSGIPFEPASEDEDIGGDIIFGKDIFTGRDMGFYLAELTKPTAVFGATGFYKTTTLLNISYQLIEKGIPVIIIDRKGRQFRCLQQAFPDKVMVMQTNGQFPYNPYSITDEGYQTRLAEIRAAVFERHDSSNLFLEVLRNESQKYIPCEHDLHNAVVKLKFKKGFSNMLKLQQSLLAVSTGLVSGGFGKTLAYRKGIDINEVLERKISLVIESPNTSIAQLEYLVTSLINECTYHLRNREMDHNRLSAVLVIDEASELFRERQGIPPIIEASTKIRQPGIGLIAGMHAPHLAHSMFRANIHSMLCYRTLAKESINTIQFSFFLKKEVAEYIPKQPPGEGFSIAGGRYTKALGFVVLNPPMQMNLNISNEAVEQANSTVMKTLSEIVPWKGKILTVTEQEHVFGSLNEESGDMTEKEKEFLDYILHRFDLPVTDVYRELRLSADEGNRISFSVINKNLASSVWLNPSGRKGGLSKFIVPSDKYFAITGKEKPITGTDGKGSEHSLMLRFTLKNIKEIKKCHEVEISRSFQDAVSDIYFAHNGSAYVAEICSSTMKTETQKIKKIFTNSQVSFAFVIVKDRETLESVENEFNGFEFRNRVLICLLSSFLNSGIEGLINQNKTEV